jgi:hypothetical protein
MKWLSEWDKLIGITAERQGKVWGQGMQVGQEGWK